MVRAYCLDKCPPALAVGRLCIDLGYDFWWPAHSHTVVLTRPDGVQILSGAKNYTPMLTEQVYAAAAQRKNSVPGAFGMAGKGSEKE